MPGNRKIIGLNEAHAQKHKINGPTILWRVTVFLAIWYFLLIVINTKSQLYAQHCTTPPHPVKS